MDSLSKDHQKMGRKPLDFMEQDTAFGFQFHFVESNLTKDRQRMMARDDAGNDIGIVGRSVALTLQPSHF